MARFRPRLGEMSGLRRLLERAVRREVTPPGYEDVVQALKRKGTVANPWAVAWAMKAKRGEARREAAPRESAPVMIFDGFREARITDADRTARVTLIEAGLGNLRDMHFYTNEALRRMPRAFEGLKVYADHPTSSEDRERPERSVRDIIGHYEDVRYEEANGRGRVTATIKVLPGEATEWAWTQIKEAANLRARFPDKPFVGLSINANGSSETMSIEEVMAQYAGQREIVDKLADAAAKGKREVNMVHEVTDAVSADLVTSPGAGGGIESINKESRMAELRLLESLVRNGRRTKALSAIRQMIEAEDEGEGKRQAKEPKGKHEEVEVDEDGAALEAAAAAAESAAGVSESEEEAERLMKMAERLKRMAAERREKAEAKETQTETVKTSEPARQSEAERRVACLEAQIGEMKRARLMESVISEYSIPESWLRRALPQLREATTEAQMREIMDGWQQDWQEVAAYAPATIGTIDRWSADAPRDHHDLFAGCLKPASNGGK